MNNSTNSYNSLQALLEDVMPGDELEASRAEIFQAVSPRGRFRPTATTDEEDWTDFDDMMQGNDQGDVALFRKSKQQPSSNNKQAQECSTTVPLHRVDSTQRLCQCGRAAWTQSFSSVSMYSNCRNGRWHNFWIFSVVETMYEQTNPVP